MYLFWVILQIPVNDYAPAGAGSINKGMNLVAET